MKQEELTEVLQAFVKSRTDSIHTCIPGRFESYSGHASRKASVRPLVQFRSPENDNISMPIIENVPVIFPSSSNFNLLYPIKKGDGCLILFAETGIGNFLAGTGQEVPADDQSRFSLTDAIAIPGLWTFKNSPEEPTIEIDESGILNLFSGIESFVKGDTLETVLTNFLTPISAIVPGTVAENATALGVIKTVATTMLSVLSTIKSLKIKGE